MRFGQRHDSVEGGVMDDNKNNRFEAAAELNGCFEGEGPFWGRPAGRDIPGILGTRPQHGWGVNLPPRLRYAECVVPSAWFRVRRKCGRFFTLEVSAGRR